MLLMLNSLLMNLFMSLGFVRMVSMHEKRLMLLCLLRRSGTVLEYSAVFSVSVSKFYHIASSLLISVMHSMLIKLSKPSHWLKNPLFSMLSPPLKLFMVLGLLEPINPSTVPSKRRFMPQPTNSMRTMRKLQTPTPTFLLCVCAHGNLTCVLADKLVASTTSRT
jgi:hypothetical protein